MWVHIVDMFHMTGDVSGRRGASSTYFGSEETRKIAQLMGGDAGCESTLGKGVCSGFLFSSGRLNYRVDLRSALLNLTLRVAASK